MVAFMAITVKKAAFKSKSFEQEEKELNWVQMKERLFSATRYSWYLHWYTDILTGREVFMDLIETNERWMEIYFSQALPKGKASHHLPHIVHVRAISDLQL